MIRQHLWLAGLDYPAIETGHGISHGLGIVNGGASISALRTADSFGLKDGMIVSIGNFGTGIS
jgi:Xaa-Pro aminopeptidase